MNQSSKLLFCLRCYSGDGSSNSIHINNASGVQATLSTRRLEVGMEKTNTILSLRSHNASSVPLFH